MAVLPESSWWQQQDILRPVVIGTICYFFLYGSFKVLGAGSLAQVTVVGFIVQVTIGSTLATLFLNSDVSLVKGLIAFCVYFLWDVLISLAIALWPPLNNILRDNPVCIYHQDHGFLRRTMLINRSVQQDIDATMRSNGYTDYSSIHAIVLEINGKYSIIKKGNEAREAMRSVKNYPPQEQQDKDAHQWPAGLAPASY